ncbi:Com family DNA-binding transcriptional regulator [Desulfovibrio aminophilus]|uniref:Com family DNA-binding transcriptional regulator n=1 Tax=Desulfovibrio aminophilus TaxID=81425 RepID=UPI00339A41F2
MVIRMRTLANSTPEIRCRNCNRLLARGSIEAGEIELQCPRCKTRLLLRVTRPSHAPHDGLHGDRYANESSSRK